MSVIRIIVSVSFDKPNETKHSINEPTSEIANNEGDSRSDVIMLIVISNCTVII